MTALNLVYVLAFIDFIGVNASRVVLQLFALDLHASPTEVGLLGLAFINAQAYIWSQMGLAVSQGTFSIMFYAVTGTITALAIAGVVFSTVTAFRFLGGRTTDHESVSAHALYWYAFSAVFAVLWFVVYVTK